MWAALEAGKGMISPRTSGFIGQKCQFSEPEHLGIGPFTYNQFSFVLN